MAAHAVFDTHMLRKRVTAMNRRRWRRARADQAQGEEGDAPVEAPALDGEPDDEAAHEEKDHVRGVGREDLAEGRDAQQRESVTIGSSAVTSMSTASVSHHPAIQTISPSVARPACVKSTH
jgi:hypothetical protein